MAPFAALVLLLGAFAGGDEETRGSAAPLTIYTQFENTYSERAVAEMKSELAAIMDPIGVDLEWRSIRQNHGDQISVELVVVSFKGSCGTAKPLPLRRDDNLALGVTHVSDGVVLPFSDIDCDRIRRLIHPYLKSEPPPDRDAKLGRAMARVLAHELYHVFTRTRKHGHHGIAKGVYTARELVSKAFHFDAKELASMRDSGLMVRLNAPANARAVSEGGGR